MQCKLCLQDKDLLNKSHIIPDFMYREIFDEQHSLIRFTTLTPKSDSTVFNGEYEGNILCVDCDNKLIGHQFEDYASKVLYGGNITLDLKNFRKPDGLEFSQISGLDYAKFKLFLLSVLWRASISSRPFFNSVSLGPYEEKIRQAILDKNPLSAGDFPCIMLSHRKRNFPNKLIMAPKKFRFKEGNKIGYHFLIGGISYMFKMIEGDNTDWVLEAAAGENGMMMVIHSTEDQARTTVNKIFGVNVPLDVNFE